MIASFAARAAAMVDTVVARMLRPLTGGSSMCLIASGRNTSVASASRTITKDSASCKGNWSNGDELTQSLHACVARVRENPPVYWHPKRSDIPAGPPAILGADDDDRAARRDMADVLADPIAALSEHPVTAKGTKKDPIVL
jgi:hypothetical protein